MKDFVNCCETFWNSSLSHFPRLLILYDIHLPFKDTKFKRKSQTHTHTPIWLHNNDFYWSNVFEFYNKYPSERNLFLLVPSSQPENTHTHSQWKKRKYFHAYKLISFTRFIWRKTNYEQNSSLEFEPGILKCFFEFENYLKHKQTVDGHFAKVLEIDFNVENVNENPIEDKLFKTIDK